MSLKNEMQIRVINMTFNDLRKLQNSFIYKETCQISILSNKNRQYTTGNVVFEGFPSDLANNTFIEVNKTFSRTHRCFDKKYRFNSLCVCAINQLFMRDNA